MTGGPDLSLVDVGEAARVVADAADPDANIIFGATIDPDLEGQVWVTVVAANFTGVRAVPAPPPEPAKKPAATRDARRPGRAGVRVRGLRPVAGPGGEGHPLRPALPGHPQRAGARDGPRARDAARLRRRVGRHAARDPDATTIIRRSDLQGDDDERGGPEDAA